MIPGYHADNRRGLWVRTTTLNIPKYWCLGWALWGLLQLSWCVQAWGWRGGIASILLSGGQLLVLQALMRWDSRFDTRVAQYCTRGYWRREYL